LRKLAAAVLAVPVLAAFYVPVLLRRSIAARVGLALGMGGVIGIAAIGTFGPARTTAVAPSVPAPVASAAFGPAVRTGLGPHAGVIISFSRPMDRATVAGAVAVVPASSVALDWNAASTLLTVRPRLGWTPDTFYTITVGPTAADAAGHATGTPTRTAFVTRRATAASISATVLHGEVADVRTAFRITFDHPVDAAAATAAFSIQPAVAGTFEPSVDATTVDQLVFTPSVPLAQDVAYRVSLAGPVTDEEGGAIATPGALALRTATVPAVVRFRPRNGTTEVAAGAALSVRFTEPMDRASTAAAFSATAGGKRLKGKIRWAEGDTVLVFTPSGKLPPSAAIRMSVAVGARAASGVELQTAALASAKTTKPVPLATASRSAGSSSGPTKQIPRASGGSVGSGSWGAVEAYYLRLMNCTRTGGWVTSDGSCSSPGGLSTPPIVLDEGLSDSVSRPYAKLLATTGACSHFIDGNPTYRLHRAGYGGWAAENIGCRSASNGFESVLGTHLFYQDEKPCGGYCHYANLMNPEYTRCGIGVWISGGVIRLVIDFYHS
jgi:uncharacterized protein YkwD